MRFGALRNNGHGDMHVVRVCLGFCSIVYGSRTTIINLDCIPHSVIFAASIVWQCYMSDKVAALTHTMYLWITKISMNGFAYLGGVRMGQTQIHTLLLWIKTIATR